VARMKSLIVFTMKYLKGMDAEKDVSESRMDEILDYIHKNIQKNITRKDVAEAVYLNAEYLSRLFKKEKGITLSDYILREKMNIAKLLLETTNFSVSIVASKVGYSNFSHFAQSFKRIFGISPSEIRQDNHS
jgi:two-component system response regulator YesN